MPDVLTFLLLQAAPFRGLLLASASDYRHRAAGYLFSAGSRQAGGKRVFTAYLAPLGALPKRKN